MQYRNPFIELCIEGTFSLFKGLNQIDKELLNNHHALADFTKNSLIIKEGDKPRGLPVLITGKAKLYGLGAGNREQIIKLLKPQSIIVFKALFSDHPYPFSCKALEESAVIIFEKPVLIKIIKHNPDIAVRIMKIMAEDIVFTNNRLISLTQKHVRGRLAESLLLLRDTYGTDDDGKTLRITLPREDIAHLSNMTTSNAIRTLSSFADERIIGIERKKILILDHLKLEEISESGQ